MSLFKKKPPKPKTIYECPVHGERDAWVRFEGKNYCMKCCAEKVVELGVHELVEKKI